MAFQNIFKRYETKYLLDHVQKAAVLQAMAPHMIPDSYGKTTVRNLYYDTDDYRLIRHSLEHPVYKEKLRLRSYARVAPDATVFVELKKKYDGVVYKRRIPLPARCACRWLAGAVPCPEPGQISREVDHCLRFYGSLAPRVFLSYEREAYYDKNNRDFRVTFDENILCRQDALDLGAEIYGTAILPPGITLMEIKCAGGIPLWMTRTLTRQKIYKTSFSKYGTAYRRLIFPKLQEVKTNV